MRRKRLTELYPWLLPVRRKQRKLFFYTRMYFDRNHYAGEQIEDTLPVQVFQSSCPVYNKETGFDMVYQENKAHNLRLASGKINGLLIKPGETFSFWNRVKDADKSVPYKEALTELNGVLQTEYGGGLCQISNMLNWVFLHSPLTIIERHGHMRKDFPEPESDALKGVDATVAEGWKDFCVKNDTDYVFQICLTVDQNSITGILYTERDPFIRWDVVNDNLRYFKDNDGVYEEVDVIRVTKSFVDYRGTEKRLVYRNKCLIGYPIQGVEN